jgi:hypothetical protein
MLEHLSDNHLSPLDQLFFLNKEIYEIIDLIEKPVIVVGGQAVNYWVEYYSQQYEVTDAIRATATSVDVDYCGNKEDFSILTEKWKVEFNKPPIGDSTPEIGNSILRDKDTNKIKEAEGFLFVDIGAWVEDKKEKPNQVDLLDLPVGFERLDFENNRLTQHTIPFEFPGDFVILPHEKLRILNPVGCIKSRMLNYKCLKRQKSPALEIERIRTLIIPTVLFLQSNLIENGYKSIRPYLDLLMILAKSSLGMELRYSYQIDLAQLLSFVVDSQKSLLPEKFIHQEFHLWMAGVERKFQRKVVQYEQIEDRKKSKDFVTLSV